MAVYTPPKVWKWNENTNHKFASINRPISGSTHIKELPVGKHPLQLYSVGTPNGVKVTILLEELLALGHEGAEYNAHLINILQGEQFASGFVGVNPNSKIPALLDLSTEESVRVFESAAIVVYLSEKFNAFFPRDAKKRAECLSWVFWSAGSAPFLGGGFGHFYAYAPMKIEYAIDRYALEVKRQLDVLNRHLADKRYMCGDEYTIADMVIWPWYGALSLGRLYGAAEFLDVSSYQHLTRWSVEISERRAVKRGAMVNNVFGKPSKQLRERHDASDFEHRTEDKVEGIKIE